MYIACQSFGSVCWTLEAIILQHTYLGRMYSLKNRNQLWTTPSWTTMTIRLSQMLFTRRVLIARRWQHFYHNIHLSRIDCRITRRRNLPWGQPLRLPWTLHRGRVLNAGKDCLFRKLFHRGPVKTSRWRKIPA